MLQAGIVLQGRYQLKQKIGQNAGRQTWLAADLLSEPMENVIVKILAFGGDVQWEDLKLFEREAQVLKHLSHPRIPKYRDYFSIDERHLWFGLVQEYIPGNSLKELLENGKRFTEKEICQIAEEILKILIDLHQLNPPVLHRDIKPSNLVLAQDNQVYLVDFGAVQERAAKEGVTFTVVGTYGYVPMEQFGGRAVPASDLYALGATLIHLLTGTAPADLPQDDLRIDFQSFTNARPSLIRWVQTLTEPSLKRRFSTAQEALEALYRKSNPQHLTVIPSSQSSASMNNSGCGGIFDLSIPVPEEIKGWNWGAFLMPWFWPFSNKVWIGLLVWMPQLGWLAAIALGARGNEWAWKSRKWHSIEQFKAHQRGWAIAGILMWMLIFGLGLML